MRTHIGAYSRISFDWEGKSLGVDRQRADAVKLAELRGWEITNFYTDNNISAFKSNVLRPEFERMLVDLESGKIDGILAYDLDRIARQPTDLERIIRIYELRKGLVFATVQGSIDLSTSDGLTMARIMVTFANKSSMDTSRRTKRKNLERAEAGFPHGGHRPYGYNADLMTPHPEEGPLLYEMGMKFIAGQSYKDLAYWMNENGNQTTTGKLWYPITVRNTLARARNAGFRVHLGVVYVGNEGWKPIFSRDEWLAIEHTAKLRREKAGDRPAAKKYLLTGFLRCGKCGNYLNGETKRDHPSRPLRRTYQCRVHGDTQKKGGCGGVTRNADALEHFIRELICYRLDSPDIGRSLVKADPRAPSRELLKQRDVVVALKNGLIDDYADGLLNKKELARAQNRLEGRLTAIDRGLDDLRRTSVIVSLDPGQTVRSNWLSQTDGFRRQLISLLIDEITVNVGKTKPYYDVDGVRMRFDPKLIDVKWLV